jgi:hypothetical protein
LQRSADQIPDKVIPDLNRLYDEFRTLGTSLKLKIEKLQSTVANHGYHAESELMSMTNLKECVQSAADVVSTASTTLAPEASEKASVKYGSDFGDVFRKESNEPMQRWISSNTVYEYEDAEAPALDPSETSTVEAITEYQSDSDSDIENELVRALFRNGKKRKKAGDLQGAARTLKNCLSRLPTASTYSSMTSSQATSITGVSKVELLEMLTETYCEQGAWAEAKSTMTEMLAITEHQTGRKSERYLWDTYKLSEVMVKTKDFAEAHLHGRQSLRGFRKLREQGFDGYEKSLTLLIFICSEQGNAEEEKAYTALLESHQSNMEERQTWKSVKQITGSESLPAQERKRLESIAHTCILLEDHPVAIMKPEKFQGSYRKPSRGRRNPGYLLVQSRRRRPPYRRTVRTRPSTLQFHRAKLRYTAWIHLVQYHRIRPRSKDKRHR